MKILSHSVNGGTITAMATDRMRRPVKITIKVEQMPVGAVGGEMPMITGKVEETADLFREFARIAWNDFKWRPANLGAVVAHVVGNLKVPGHEPK